MEEIMRLLGLQQQQTQPPVDQDGIALPPSPGGTVGQPQPQQGGLMEHYGNMTGGQPMDPTMIQMLLRMFGGGQQ